MRGETPRGVGGGPVRLLVATVLTALLGWAVLAIERSGEISVRAGGRAARGVFEASRSTDPEQFNGGLAFVSVLFLLSFAAMLSTAWDIVAASRRGSDSAS